VFRIFFRPITTQPTAKPLSDPPAPLHFPPVDCNQSQATDNPPRMPTSAVEEQAPASSSDRSVMREDLELRQARELMAPPDHWDDGFGLKAIIGAVFVGLIMTPASMYMGLVIGSEIGQAAQWVTIILFMEVARRAFTTLKRPEIYILYYMAGATLASGSGGLLWNQFLVQSESFRQLGLADKIPSWAAPSSPDILGLRSFFHPAWFAPIGLIVLGLFLQRVDHFGLGYVMYRLTSDVEKLPFPMAPVAAQGITALADASGGSETWRWRVFSFGAMLGILFGAVYLALPTISGALLPEPISIFPVPFKDLTPNTETFLPGVPVMLSFDIGLLIMGMVLPYWAMIGSFIGLVVTMTANPILYHAGILRTWRTGIGAPATINSNLLDFYLSFGFGLTIAIAVIGFWHIGAKLLSRKRELAEQTGAKIDFGKLFKPPPGRGDFSIWIGVAIYVFSTAVTLIAAVLLLRHAQAAGVGGPITTRLVGVLLFYGFVFTPVMSYIGARIEGIVGLSAPIPFVREATLMLTGYRGAAIWFVPFAPHNYGNQALYFRVTELTGTKLTSLIKAETVIFPISIIATLLFSQFIWRIAPVPSSAFPWAEKWWEVNAFRLGVIYSSTLPGGEYGPFYQAFHPLYMLIGLLIALVMYGGLAFYGLPIFLAYGVIRGLDHPAPANILPQFIGALLGRHYFAKKFGEQWKQYIVVFFAGFSCGMGLVMMFSLGIVFMSKSVFQSAY
jgi:hypothetical protein